MTSSTEGRNPVTFNLDTVSTEDMLQMLYNEDALAIRAVSAVADQTATAVDAAFERLSRKGKIHYFGAGASGRLALLDATEIPPTFGADPELFTAHFPGGMRAIMDPTIDQEDSDGTGFDDAAGIDRTSVAVGITASGATAYVAGALRRSRSVGALSILITCNPAAPLRRHADICIVADTGPEALTGSTRLKAGTATKSILNSFSTTLMVRSGRTYSNLMVGLVATNSKLRERAIEILVEATGRGEEECSDALSRSDGEVPVALVHLLTECEVQHAREILADGTSARDAIAALSGARR